MSKFAVITGSSGGIGSALVDAFLSDNYFVVGIDTIDSGRNSVGFLEIHADLFEFTKNENYREQILNQINNHLPEKLDDFVLINNAAVQILNPVSELNWSDWDKTLNVNTMAPFFLVQGFLEQLIKTHGHVINISSIHSRLTKANFSCYATSKAALEALTRSLALEMAKLLVAATRRGQRQTSWAQISTRRILFRRGRSLLRVFTWKSST